MHRLGRRLGLVAWALPLLVAACATSRQTEQPGPTPAVDAREPAPTTEGGLYAADEALVDTLSGDLVHVGTGRWPGIARLYACAFRNDRVLIVNAYCSITEMQALRIDVYSPERGRVRIYAEANGPVSEKQRDDYFTFTVESEPLPGAEANVAAVGLGMSFEELQRYEQARYDAYLPGCYGGEQNSEQVGGCLGALASHEDQWAARNRAFLEQANDDWYRVVREMRAVAARHGKDPD